MKKYTYIEGLELNPFIYSDTEYWELYEDGWIYDEIKRDNAFIQHINRGDYTITERIESDNLEELKFLGAL